MTVRSGWRTATVVCGVVVVLAACLLTASGNAAAAGTGSGIITTPIFDDLAAGPGTTAITTIQVENSSSSPVTLTIRTEEFKAKGVLGEAQIYTPPAGDQSTSWVHYSQNDFTAQPGVLYPIKVTIAVPKTASFGYYYAVLVSPDTGSTSSQNTAIIHASNAIFLLLDTNLKGEDRKLQISSFTSSRGLYDYLPATFNVLVHNPGNIYIVPQGNIYITRTPTGKTIDALTINSDGGNVLPNSDREFQAQWTNGFPVYQIKRLNGQIVSGKNGAPIEQLTWNFSSPLSEFRFGRYYAHLALAYNDGITEVPINAVVSFWVIPWPLILEVVGAIIVIVAVWKLFKRSMRKLKRMLFTKTKKTPKEKGTEKAEPGQ